MAALPSEIRGEWSEGDLWYDTTANAYKVYNGSAWALMGQTGTTATVITGATDTISAANDNGAVNSYTSATAVVTLPNDMTGIIVTLVNGGTGTLTVNPGTGAIDGGALGNGTADKYRITSGAGSYVKLLGVVSGTTVVLEEGGVFTEEA